jgi:hypothetical protein
MSQFLAWAAPAPTAFRPIASEPAAAAVASTRSVNGARPDAVFVDVDMVLSLG